MRITVAMLREHGACRAHVLVFRRLWPRGVEVTAAAARKAMKAGLCLGWAARSLLSARAEVKNSEGYRAAWDDFWRQAGQGSKLLGRIGTPMFAQKLDAARRKRDWAIAKAFVAACRAEDTQRRAAMRRQMAWRARRGPHRGCVRRKNRG